MAREEEILKLRRTIRLGLGVFIVGLILSGGTAFPLLTELQLLCTWLGLPTDAAATNHTGLSHWLLLVREGLATTYARYPFIAYGTDWLAFGHLVIALFSLRRIASPERTSV